MRGASIRRINGKMDIMSSVDLIATGAKRVELPQNQMMQPLDTWPKGCHMCQG